MDNTRQANCNHCTKQKKRRRTFSGFWTAFQTLVDTLDLPSAWQKTQVIGQDIKEIPSLFIHNYKLEVAHEVYHHRQPVH